MKKKLKAVEMWSCQKDSDYTMDGVCKPQRSFKENGNLLRHNVGRGLRKFETHRPY